MSNPSGVDEPAVSESPTFPLRRLMLFTKNSEGKTPLPHLASANKPRAFIPSDTTHPIIPGHEIIRQLGRGGMGVVYLAREVALNRQVAIKVVAASGALVDDDAFQRFQHEAESVAALQHPNIIQIFGLGTSEATGGQSTSPFLALEYADAGTLNMHTGKPITPRVAVELVATLADAIQYAHDRGIVHRDLKPSNVLMSVTATPTPKTNDALSCLTPKITDFGVAKRLVTAGETLDSRTIAGSVIGTPEYMAPEQANGRGDIGPAADVYALGVILYELLTGRVPLQGADSIDTLLLVRTQDAVPPSRLQARLPRDLDTICMQCLQKDPARRYATAAALKADLEAWLQGHPIAARPISPAERAWKWASRHPAIAGLLAAVVWLTVVGSGGVFWQWQRAEARAAAERDAHATADLAREKAETALYFGRVHVAQHELATGNHWDAIRVLKECRPEHGQSDQRSWEWSYLKNLSRNAKHSFQASSNWVWDVAFSPDGRWLATAAGSPYPLSASIPGEVAIWDATTGEFVQKLAGHTRAARHVVFSPNGQYLLSFGYDRTARIWDLPSGRQVGQPLPIANEGHHHWQAFGDAGPGWFTADSQAILFRGPDQWQRFEISTGRLETVPHLQAVISASRDATIALMRETHEVLAVVDLKTMRTIRRIEVPYGVDRAIVSPDNLWVVTSNNNLVETYDMATGRRKEIFNGPMGWVESLQISPDGTRIAAAGSDRTIYVWNVGQRVCSATFTGHTTEVRALAFSPDGLQLASCDQLGRVMMWDPNRNPQQQLINGHMHSSNVSALALSADGERIMTVRYEGFIQHYDMTGRRTSELLAEGLSTQVRFPRNDVQFNGDGSLVFGPCDKDQTTVGCWNAETGKVIRHFRGHTLPISGIAVSGDGRRIATTAGPTRNDGSTSKETFVWDVATGQRLHDVTKEMIIGIALSSDGTQLSGVSFAGDIILWDVATGRELWRKQGHGDAESIAAKEVRVFAIAFSRDDSHIATGGFSDGSVRVWNTRTGEPHPVPMVARPSLTGITFSPDGKRVAAAGYDSEVRMWDVTTGILAIVLPPPSGPRRGDIAHTARPVFSQHNSRLALVDSRGFIGCWNGREQSDAD